MTVYFKDLGRYGRLGNSLFQAATTIALALRTEDGFGFPEWEHQGDFNLPIWCQGNLPRGLVPTYNEPHFHYSPIPKINNWMNIKGYFQSEKYFKDQEGKVKEYLTPKYRVDNSDYCSLHVRRTDYLQHSGCYTILNRNNYYDRAMEIIGADKYLIFSDDLAWCRDNFRGNEFDFSYERHPVKDLANMIGCSNFIIGNSSFSWWGAWLSLNPGKKVVAPRNWFGPKLAPTHDTKDLIPGGWELI